MSTGTDRSGADEAGREFLNGRSPKRKEKTCLDGGEITTAAGTDVLAATAGQEEQKLPKVMGCYR